MVHRRSMLFVLAATLLVACGGRTLAVTTPGAASAVSGVAAPVAAELGIYVSGYGGTNDTAPFVLGYDKDNRQNDPPICSETVPSVDDVAADEKGDLIVPESSGVEVFAGPDMCGSKLGKLGETLGKAVDAASIDATNGPIVLAISSNESEKGSLLICSLKNGCTTHLHNPDIHEVVGVALAKNGDCWVSSNPVALTYFQGCSGSGQTATGYANPYPGGVDIDKDGNLVAISTQTLNQSGNLVPLSSQPSGLYVYSGCKPACKRIGGPFSMEGQALYGHLNADSTTFAAADYRLGQIDVYRYGPNALTYMYSFNNGLFETSIKGVAYNRRSEEQPR
jgi:hypothetical protein